MLSSRLTGLSQRDAPGLGEGVANFELQQGGLPERRTHRELQILKLHEFTIFNPCSWRDTSRLGDKVPE